MDRDWQLSDGVVTIRPPHSGDATILIAGRDDEWARWLSPGVDNPNPTACIVVDDVIVGWVDFDPEADGLAPGEINVGYNVFAPFRRNGYATRAVLLLLEKVRDEGRYDMGVARIAHENRASIRVAIKAGFVLTDELPAGLRFARPVR
jgi:RimJ/RimL family protein N-acetyltransferase